MAIVTGSATSNGSFSNLSISGTSTRSGNITWSRPTIPSGATITSTSLRYTLSINMTKSNGTVTVNGTTRTAGTYTLSLGTSITTSVAVTAKGDKNNARGTVSISSITYTVNYEYNDGRAEYTVTFVDYDGRTLKTQTVMTGESATPPSNPSRVGYNFTGWSGNYTNIQANTTITATYSIIQYTVRFIGFDGGTLKTQTVNYGSAAEAPTPPEIDGWIFERWDTDFSNVTRNLTVTAIYSEAQTSSTIRIGTRNITNILLGTDIIQRVYAGAQLIWGNVPSIPQDENLLLQLLPANANFSTGVWTDSSGNDRNATLYNFTNDGTTNGLINGKMVFSTANNYARIPRFFEGITPINQITITVKGYRTTATGDWGKIISLGTDINDTADSFMVADRDEGFRTVIKHGYSYQIWIHNTLYDEEYDLTVIFDMGEYPASMSVYVNRVLTSNWVYYDTTYDEVVPDTFNGSYDLYLGSRGGTTGFLNYECSAIEVRRGIHIP